MNVEITTEQVTAAGRSMTEVAAELAGVRPDETLTPLPDALRGAASAATISRLTDAWVTRCELLTTAIDRHGDALVTSADDYVEVEDTIKNAINDMAQSSAGA